MKPLPQKPLIQSSGQFQLLFERLADPMLLIDCESGCFTDCNEAAIRLLGYREKADLFQLKPIDISPEYQPDGRLTSEKAMEMHALARQRGHHRFEWLHRSPDGRLIPVEILLTSIETEGNAQLAAVWHDLSANKRTLEELRLKAGALETVANGIVITNREGVIEWVNPAFTRLTGYTAAESVGRTPQVLKSGRHGASFYAEMWSTIIAGKVWHGEVTNQRKDGVLYEEEMSITPLRDGSGNITHFVAVKQDTTERKKLQNQILRTQRMESLGTLAGGIAHDLNNILLPIVLSTDLLRNGETRDERLRLLDTIRSCARRGADMIRQVLTFARGVEGLKGEVQLLHLFRDLEKILRETFPRNLSIGVKLPKELWTVHGEATQLEQVLMNLCINARDAMPVGGVLTLSAHNVLVDASMTEQEPDCLPGNYVLVEVGDDGMGMSAEVQERIFEPFFTTKEVGKGTGLGLSTVYSIVRGHRGFLQVISRPGHGSVFRVYLPALSGAVHLPAQDPNSPLPTGSGEWILVVDDEKAVCEAVRLVLSGNGYHVLLAADGAEALGLYHEHRDKIALTLTDIMMPVMDGATLISRIRKMDPEAKIIAASGNDTGGARFQIEGEIGRFLAKPYSVPILLEAVHCVLHEPVE